LNNKQNDKTYFEKLKPWIGTLVILPLACYYTLNRGQFTFIDYINLLIHEGGHGIFKFFGKFIYTLGGTLMQIIIPGMFVVFYMIKKKKIMSQLFLIWLGQNLINISVYAADARAKKLPLLGGNKVYHDWNWLLTQTGLLEYDGFVGNTFFAFGVISFLFALVIPLILKEEQMAELNLPL
jgi:hypothetical protein